MDFGDLGSMSEDGFEKFLRKKKFARVIIP